MKVLAHRGWSGKYPENTMLAFEKAIEIGSDGIELDVHLSADGEVMVIHDESLERTAGVKGAVSDYKRSELERISAGKTKEDSYGFTPIPSLEEYLCFMKDKSAITNIELKTAPVYYPGIEEKTLALVDSFGLRDRVVFSSFNWMSALRIKTLAPEIPCGLLHEFIKIFNQASLIKTNGFEYFHPGFKLVDDSIVEDCKKHGVGLNIWTVNEEEDIRKCQAWDINGVITNHPDLALRIIRGN